jgi:hypothetical protein
MYYGEVDKDGMGARARAGWSTAPPEPTDADAAEEEEEADRTTSASSHLAKGGYADGNECDGTRMDDAPHGALSGVVKFSDFTTTQRNTSQQATTSSSTTRVYCMLSLYRMVSSL